MWYVLCVLFGALIGWTCAALCIAAHDRDLCNEQDCWQYEEEQDKETE